MVVTCTHCNVRLQLDDAKIPARAFTLRCPKCQAIVNVQPPATAATPNDQSALAVGDSPATEHPRFEQPKLAPAFKLEGSEDEANAAPSSASLPGAEAGEVARLLLELLQRGGVAADKKSLPSRLAWERRKVLVCVSPLYREMMARALAKSDYQVFVAGDMTQAVESMREEHVDIVILDPEFDPVEQGAAFVTREVNTMRSPERRRLFFVHFSPTVRTLDTHAAFINNVNLVVNPVDIENLPQALERAIRDYNELYRELNAALNVAAI
ncbi:MAG TPA: zinc-ribbon domain-containing protein [Pyrinomonadaceae bacterium]|jgi:predicted Zn finger-like uncharacterized protein|nr:zinc-ribbon domain-containing protein [Pyrinomonadaceae bacterium]